MPDQPLQKLDEQLILDQTQWIPPGGQKKRKRRARGGKKTVRREAAGSRYPAVLSCPRTLQIPGLDHEYTPGTGWRPNILKDNP